MLSEAHYESALNFFFFLLLDEEASLHCALRVIKGTQKKSKNRDIKKIETLLIGQMAGELRRALKKEQRAPTPLPKSDWKPPSQDDFATWKDFLRRAEMDSAEALVLRFILNYPVETIAEALEVPEGTIYFRLGRGLEAYTGGRYG